MSQQTNNVEKHVAQEDAAIAIPDKEIVSINYDFSYFTYVLYLFVYISFLENSPQFLWGTRRSGRRHGRSTHYTGRCKFFYYHLISLVLFSTKI